MLKFHFYCIGIARIFSNLLIFAVTNIDHGLVDVVMSPYYANQRLMIMRIECLLITECQIITVFLTYNFHKLPVG